METDSGHWLPDPTRRGQNRDTHLAYLLRRGQWLLDDAAHHLPAGRLRDVDRHALADTLNQLAAALRESAPVVIDSSGGQ